MSNSTSEAGRAQQISLLEDCDSNAAIEPLAWRVRTSRRVRNPKIQVFPHGGVEVVVRPGTSPRFVEAFVRENAGWIEQTRREFSKLRPAEAALPDEIKLPAIDQKVPVHYSPHATSRAREAHGILRISSPNLNQGECWPLLQNWLKRKAKPYLQAAVSEESARTGLRPKRVQVRLQSTRWGSCSSSGTLSLNAALLLRSPEELRYVVIHELCHLQHMNHSKTYWQLVKSFEPGYRRYERSLDKAWQISPLWLIS